MNKKETDYSHVHDYAESRKRALDPPKNVVIHFMADGSIHAVDNGIKIVTGLNPIIASYSYKLERVKK